MAFFGWVFLITTLGIWFLKREHKVKNTYVRANRQRPGRMTLCIDQPAYYSCSLWCAPGSEKELTVSQTYSRLLDVCKQPSIQSLAFVALTCRIGFAGIETVTPLKLQVRSRRRANHTHALSIPNTHSHARARPVFSS
jgi:hypothetical protein